MTPNSLKMVFEFFRVVAMDTDTKEIWKQYVIDERERSLISQNFPSNGNHYLSNMLLMGHIVSIISTYLACNL